MTTMSDKSLRNNLSSLRSEERKRKKAAHQVAVQSCNRDLVINLAKSILMLCPHPTERVLTQTTSRSGKKTCLCCRKVSYLVDGSWKDWRPE